MNFLPKDSSKLQELVEILDELEWNVAYQMDPETNNVYGIICGGDEYIQEMLGALSELNGGQLDINVTHKGNKEDLN